MSKKITFIVYGNIIPKMRPRATTGGGFTRVYTPSKQKMNENLIADAYFREVEKTNFEGFGESPVKLEVLIHDEVPKSFSKKKRQLALDGKLLPVTHNGDLDNRLKTICDGLNHTNCWKDDCYVAKIIAERIYDEKDYAEITISEYSQRENSTNETIIENININDDEMVF